MRAAVRAGLAVFGGWTALALLLAVSNSLTYRSTGRPTNWGLTISRALAEWWLWALLTPVVVWLAWRYALEGQRKYRHAAVLLAAGLAIAALKTVADRAVFAMISGFRVYLLASTLALQFVVFLCIVVAAHGVEYYRRSRDREQLEARLARTRLQLLGMQLQPHFLFNTLNTIAELVHHDPATADRMIVGLSDLLRITLDLGEAQQIPLSREIDILRRYLDIQRARFGPRLHVTLAVDADVAATPVPALLLQPLVENAIRHAVAPRADGGRIRVSACRSGSATIIEVLDDGDDWTAAVGERREGVGLANTRGRLDASYGPGSRFALDRVDGWTRVRLELPGTVESA